MTDQVTAGDTQAESNAHPSAGQGTGNPNPQAGTGADQQEEVLTVEKARDLRSENKSLRARLANLEKAEELRKQGEMSELQKAQAERDAVRKERDTLNAQVRLANITSAAAKAGAIYPDVVALKVPDDAEDMEAALKQVRKEYPAMFRQQGSADAGAGTNGKPLAGDFSDMIRQAAGRG